MKTKIDSELLHLKINEQYWDKWANSLDGKGWRFEYLRKCQIGVISLLELRENIKILDIGCGTGWALGEIAQKLDGKGVFYGVDLSHKMIEKAKDNFRGKTQFQFIQSKAELIPLEDNLFDIVLCINSFHHHFNPHISIREMARLLKKGGKLFILDPTIDNWFLKIIIRIMKILEPEQTKLYSTEEFRKFIIGSGLKYSGFRKIKFQQKVHLGEK